MARERVARMVREIREAQRDDAQFVGDAVARVWRDLEARGMTPALAPVVYASSQVAPAVAERLGVPESGHSEVAAFLVRGWLNGLALCSREDFEAFRAEHTDG